MTGEDVVFILVMVFVVAAMAFAEVDRIRSDRRMHELRCMAAEEFGRMLAKRPPSR